MGLALKDAMLIAIYFSLLIIYVACLLNESRKTNRWLQRIVRELEQLNSYDEPDDPDGGETVPEVIPFRRAA